MNWPWHRQKEEEWERELQDHLALEAAEQQANGRDTNEAAHAAKRAFGNTTATKELMREVWQWNWLERWKTDATYAIRLFARTPGFTAVIVATLALGIGATTAMFSIVSAMFLHPLPYPDADRLVVVWERLLHDPKAPPVFDSYQDFETWKQKSHSFDALAPATWATGQQILTGVGRARTVLAMPVGPEFFSLLGMPPALGRTFRATDVNEGCSVVLKHQFWQQTFGGRPDVIGRHITLSQQACTIIGVMPREFTFFPEAASLWRLITADSPLRRDPENTSVGVFGRLRPGVSRERAQEELTLLYENLHRNDRGGVARSPRVHPLAEQFAFLTGPNLRLTILLLFAAVCLVLLIACVNIANMLLGRSLVRQKELAVRAALGSGRLRLIRQLLTEGLLLSVAGAVLGVVLATVIIHYFTTANVISLPPGNPIRMNFSVLIFTGLLSIVTSIVFGLVPALRASRLDLTEALQASGRGTTGQRSAASLSKALVVLEVTLSFTLLAGAGLLIRSIDELSSVPLGFRTEGVLTMSLGLPDWRYRTNAEHTRLYRRLLEQVSSLPGVAGAALATNLPLNNERWGADAVFVSGQPAPDPKLALHDTTTVSITPAYFNIMNVPLKKGRLFSRSDTERTIAVAIVNEALVAKYFPHDEPLGKLIKVGQTADSGSWLTIVGVTVNERDTNFFQEMTWQEIPTVFRPVSQSPPSSGQLIVQARGDAAFTGRAIQKQIASIDSTVSVDEAQALDVRLSHVFAYPRFRALVLAAFAGLALLLAGVGLYGVLAQMVARRNREMGLRLALGAQRRDLLMMVVKQGIALTLIGLLLGAVVAFCLLKYLSSLLYNLKTTDPPTLAAVAVLLTIVAFLASYFPARRAASTDPMYTLRQE